jgi:hypothetical protein
MNLFVRIVFGVFLILHGLVHLLYLGQSQKFFELQPGLLWPDGSWAFSRLLDTRITRLLASALCILAAIGFIIGGIGILAAQAWWRPAVLGLSVFSIVIFILFWDGRFQKLDQQGGVAILINIALLVAVYIL